MRQVIYVLLLLLQYPAHAQTLPRRPFLGIQMEPVTDEVRRTKGIKEEYGVLINSVIPGSTAAGAGFMKGDVLLSINNEQLETVQEAVAIVGTQKGSSAFTYELIRNKKKLTGKANFKTFPVEQYPGLEVEYTEVKSSTGLQRMILTKPKINGKYPVVVFLGGIGCYSLEATADTSRNEIQLINELARNGYIVARVEKPGIGDGAGHSKKCNDISFTEEKEGYVEAVKKLKARADIKPDEVYVFGHSMGGLMAPLVAAETPVKGIIAYGTIGSNMMEYLAKTRRTIGQAYNWAPEETDTHIKDFCECAGYYFVEHMSTAAAAAKKQECGDLLSVFDERARKYNDELYAFNIPALWKNFAGKALLMWGASDYISAKEDHEIIAETVNHYHKGNATMMSIQSADHGMSTAASFSEARTNLGKYNREVGARVLGWLRKQS